MKNSEMTLLFLSIISLNSCDYSYHYSYQVKNDTDSELKIELKTFQIDSTYTIAMNESKVLLITDHGIEGPKGPYFEDVSFDLDKFIVTKDDTLISSKNYLDNSSWNFDNGLYSSTINDDEFK